MVNFFCDFCFCSCWDWLGNGKHTLRSVQPELHLAGGLGCDQSISLDSDKTPYEENAQRDCSQVGGVARSDRDCPGESHFVHDTREGAWFVRGDQCGEDVA